MQEAGEVETEEIGVALVEEIEGAKTKIEEVEGEVNPGGQDTLPHHLKAVVIATMFTGTRLGTACPPIPVPGLTSASRNPENSASLTRKKIKETYFMMTFFQV